MNPFDTPWRIPAGIQSRSISFENPTGKRGAGGRAASPLGPGRKGDPVRHVHDGETVVLADIQGRGTIRHIWMTLHDKPQLLRGSVIRIYWDGHDQPSVDVPVGEFFGFAHGRCSGFQSALHSVTSTRGMNSWLPMPFRSAARIEFHNRSGARLPLFYQVDYTLGDDHGDDAGTLHASFNRQNPTTPGRDFEILPERAGRIRYLGCVLGVRPLDPLWWGEGEMKAYLDGDDEWPTICGTGAEDYVGQAWGIQDEACAHHGCNWRENDDEADTGRVSLYRWHLADPIVCSERMRITIQQIGHRPTYQARTIDDYKAELFERSDDWSAAAFWYQPGPAAVPPCPPSDVLLADLPEPAPSDKPTNPDPDADTEPGT
ncbi:DUF2961 domain-containing protein [Marinihelvus fidelis]|uniref:DUF2961 domain-containing protein n=1 Tax=Marinihelvus fidelis TaxID=2613842 RepID=A0A5N0T6C6_9GAMM|nr:glycoside hydrolase family 172 protein [Marinihelvus fidelis]KAA9129697.1 DUF2961 domain-containing protein [Marinihelvus fidelis]